MRHIKLTEELKQKALQEFQQKLANERFSDNKINFTFDLKDATALTDDNKVIINVRPEAWLKMWALVSSESGEIGWHGLVTRHSDKIFEITDILVYPQFVTGVTVQTDDVGYGNWLHKELSDEQINTLRFHGHSHVNMGVSPSGVDTAWYNEILQGLFNNDYYIFAILNKRDDMFIEIYDLATNTIYEKKDIIVNVLISPTENLQDWITIEKARALQQKTPVQPVGFDTNSRLDGYKRLEDIKPFDAEEDEKVNFRDFVLNLTASDLRDAELKQTIMAELNRQAPYVSYFGAGWLKWHEMTDADKLDTAQDYYLFSKPNNAASVKTKQKQYEANKKKQRGRPRKESIWEDYYDQYD